METHHQDVPGQENTDRQQQAKQRDDEFSNPEIVHNAEEADIEEKREDRRHQQEHGNRKYKMFTNHSSADDQPTVDNGPGI